MKNIEPSSSQTSHHMIEVNDMRRYYVTAGSGELVVLLYGFPETSYAWRNIIPALSAHFTVMQRCVRLTFSAFRAILMKP